MEFGAAKEQCQNWGGRLAELDPTNIEEEQHILAALAPPDGAWIGLHPKGNGWVWESAQNAVVRFESAYPRGYVLAAHARGCKGCLFHHSFHMMRW